MIVPRSVLDLFEMYNTIEKIGEFIDDVYEFIETRVIEFISNADLKNIDKIFKRVFKNKK